jgi:hypothetical protein
LMFGLMFDNVRYKTLTHSGRLCVMVQGEATRTVGSFASPSGRERLDQEGEDGTHATS